MTKYIWIEPGGKVRIMLGCVALLGTILFIDGLREGELLRFAAGAMLAWPFATFMVRGIPFPESWARSAARQMDNAMSMQAGATSGAFRWAMVALGIVMGAAALMGGYMLLFASTETIELFVPSVAKGIRRARIRDQELLERIGFALVFGGAAGALLLTTWKRAKD
jgi:hypothetical protein